MPLDVIGSGFGRTGTASLKRALEAIGYGPCHHMEEVIQHPEQVPYWEAFVAGEAVNWDEVFAGYRSQVDWPGAHVWRQLAQAYPNAKVIHSIRPDDAWWTSFSNTIAKAMTERPPAGTPGGPPPHFARMLDAMEVAINERTFNGKPMDRETALDAYRRNTEAVKATIAPERLLVFDVREGWEPLCEFLGVPVPEGPFPRINSTEEFWEAMTGKPLDGGA